MEENKIYCSHCGALIEGDDYETVNGDIVCTDCYENHTTTCDRCGSVIWTDDSYLQKNDPINKARVLKQIAKKSHVVLRNNTFAFISSSVSLPSGAPLRLLLRRRRRALLKNYLKLKISGQSPYIIIWSMPKILQKVVVCSSMRVVRTILRYIEIRRRNAEEILRELIYQAIHTADY